MAVRSKEEILQTIRTMFGEQTSDDTITLLEDVTDTLTDYENRTSDDNNWKEKYEQNDKEWRQKYIERFFNNENDTENTLNNVLELEQQEERTKPKRFEDLFSEGEN